MREDGTRRRSWGLKLRGFCVWSSGADGTLVRRIGPRTKEKEIRAYERQHKVKVDRVALRNA